jgi:hypothetical protein
MATTWQVMIDRAKVSMGVNKSTDADFPDTQYDDTLMEIANAEIRPELRGILMEPEDSGWLETEPTFLDIVAGTTRYTPPAFDQLRSVHYLVQSGSSAYRKLDPYPQDRNSDIGGDLSGFGSLFGYYLSGDDLVLNGAPQSSVTNGLRLVVVPQIVDKALTDDVEDDIPLQFHNAVYHDLRFALSTIKGADKIINALQRIKTEAREEMRLRAHDRMGPSRKTYNETVPGSGGLAAY